MGSLNTLVNISMKSLGTTLYMGPFNTLANISMKSLGTTLYMGPFNTPANISMCKSRHIDCDGFHFSLMTTDALTMKHVSHNTLTVMAFTSL